MNKVILIGNLTRDPECNETMNGVMMCRFSIAVSRKYKNNEGGYDADFINCVAWRNNAEFASKYAKKGTKVGVVGTLQTRTYDAEDGTKRYSTDVVVDEFEILTPKNASGDDDGVRREPISDLQPIDDDSLPF